jgi:fructosamine-3-kinase
VAIERRVARALGVAATDATELEGGEVGRVHRVALGDGRTVVAKTGATPLTVEARMLRHLDDAGLPVPAVAYASDALLVLEFVPGSGSLAPAAERDAARHLAALHDRTADAYGFPFDTLSGPYHQPCPWTDDWPAFFGEHRLGHVARAARDEGALAPAAFERVDAVRADLDGLLPAAPTPSLLHGDVWAGNLVVRGGAVRAFLDPACSYGHAEVDLAYADWVGFSAAFFEAYDDARGLAPGFEERRDAYALYPILEHVRYFGAPRYRDALDRTLAALGY